MKSVVILISGRGSNMRSIVEAGLAANVRAVISNRPDAGGLAYARERGIATAVVDHTQYPDRVAFDQALAAEIDRHTPDLIVLAGFMRILTPGFVEHYAGRMINIHPSLLPAFTGLHTHRRAIEAGCRIAGVTVHFVTGELDGGPIIAQAAVPVLADDDETTLAARVLAQEHLIYPRVVRWFLEGRLTLQHGRAVLRDEATPAAGALTAPGADD
ncbi:phosphoribosylglycinamide formyltransferase [Methyloversatilis discipulorum]|uniref:phosphoribosylglycinamide formyltransferase n=1 Tax=Methyloversatilis discipulorum TaxID=1119528 RepID=UPI001A3CA919|nr:phosphoribosylglycinamide formyltransferase [Methyloversatilis discipulorum]MBL8470121.1 phosphoribosylglycinamide formyltransferase [Methyloversatilis discipulorum]